MRILPLQASYFRGDVWSENCIQTGKRRVGKINRTPETACVWLQSVSYKIAMSCTTCNKRSADEARCFCFLFVFFDGGCRAFHVPPQFLDNFLIPLSALGNANHLPGWAMMHLRASAGCVRLVKCASAEHAR